MDTATGEGFPVAVISTILQILTPETVIVNAKVSFRVKLWFQSVRSP